MPDATLQSLVSMIREAATPDLRLAALRVAGHVRSDKTLVKALIETLDDASAELRREAITALGLLKADEALPKLETFARHGGPELEAAVHAASQLGARGTKLMSKVLDEAHPFLRSRIAGVLAKSGASGAIVVTGHALLDGDPKVVESAARSLASEVPSFSAAQKQHLAKFLIETLEGKEKRPPATEAALLRVLGTLHDPRGFEVCWDRLAPSFPRDVRVAALQALGAKAQPASDARLQRLLTCAADADFQVVAGALMLLKDVAVGRKGHKPWLALLDAPDVATRRFAVEKLAGLGTKEWAQALANHIDHPDRGLRDLVLTELGGFPAGCDALLDRVLAVDQADACWFLARALAPKLKQLSPSQRGRVFEQACKHQDADDRRAAPLWFLLRELDHDGTRDQIEAKAQALRKKKKFAEAVEYYRLLAQDPAVGEEVRFELAATSLRISQHDLAPENRANDPALHQFSRLLQNSAFDLLGHVKKAKWLEPEDLFYLGFHFIEQTHRTRAFGIGVLELLVERSPKSELGKNARRKLKSEAAD